MNEGISVVIPALDEPYLETLKKRIHQNLEYCDHEIIVRDDKGCGNAILAGIREANNDIIIVMDADGSHNPNYFWIFAITFNDYDVVYGVKEVSEDYWYRKIVTGMFDFLGRLFIKDIPDLMSGYFMFDRRKIKPLPETIDHPKVLMKIIKDNKDLKVGWVNIKFEKRKGGESKLEKPSIALSIIKEMVSKST